MKLRYFKDGEFVEEIQDPEALIVLFKNDDDASYIFWGEDDKFKELLLHGIVSWPTYIPYDDETREVLVSALSRYERIDDFRYVSDVPLVSLMLQNAFDEYEPTADLEKYSFYFEGLAGTEDDTLRIDGINSHLIFALYDGQKLIAQNGSGSQKLLLVFYAIEKFFGIDARKLVEDIILGF